MIMRSRLRALFYMLTGDRFSIETAFLFALMFAPFFFMTMIADVLLILFGGILLALGALISVAIVIIKLAAPTVSDLTPNEVRS